MYPSTNAAKHSHKEHAEILRALAVKDEALAVRPMNEHLTPVEAGPIFDRKIRTCDLAVALSSSDRSSSPSKRHDPENSPRTKLT